MRRGHKRTPSATLAPPTHDPPSSTSMDTSYLHHPLEIPLLLDKSSAKAKVRVCSVESLNVDLQHYPSHLFVFGRGVMRKDAGLGRKREGKVCELQAIPEGGQQIWRKQKIMKTKKEGSRLSDEQAGGQSSHSRHEGVILEEEVNKGLKEVRSPPVYLKYKERQQTLASLLQPPLGLRGCLRSNKLCQQ